MSPSSSSSPPSPSIALFLLSSTASNELEDCTDFKSLCNANHVRLARAACLSEHLCSSLDHACNSRRRQRMATLAIAVSSSSKEVSADADCSHVCARARSNSRPVKKVFTGPSKGSFKIRSQISASCVNRGCSGHSWSRAVILRRQFATTGRAREVSPGASPLDISWSMASACFCNFL